ncbi:uncharacterized protein LOC6561240 [Drosophila grimshawi]|uniref:GH21346 n=1 Tax=Drosophila grimshawi TaxID=7222 RepID=B4J8K7_DROGR|nr:uncharacterized protein LOC6561240 [Drosophila grimshawi]EDW01274.1 GH21346 [Drosophila grimshawi]
MVFLRSFRISNRYISFHALLLLRFYLGQFYYLGLLRLRYECAGNAVRLTEYSVTISRMVALPFAYFLSDALLSPYVAMLHLQPFLFVCCLLWQPRRTYERRVQLINGFLRLAPALYRRSRRRLKLSWFLVLQLPLKLLTFKLYLDIFELSKTIIDKLVFLVIFVVPISLAVWCMDISAHLFNICLSLLLKSFEQLNTELVEQVERLHLKLLQADYRAVRRCQRRLCSLQRLHVAYVRITQQILDCLAPQLLLIVLYNITMIFALSYAHWQRLFDILILANGLRLLFQSLDALVIATGSPRDTSWAHVARLLQLNEVLAMHGWLHRHCWTSLLDMDSCEQSVRRTLLQPRLQVLGLFTPNRRLFFRLLFCYCSYLYLHYMCNKRLPVKEREIFNVMLLFSNRRKRLQQAHSQNAS